MGNLLNKFLAPFMMMGSISKCVARYDTRVRAGIVWGSVYRALLRGFLPLTRIFCTNCINVYWSSLGTRCANIIVYIGVADEIVRASLFSCWSSIAANISGHWTTIKRFAHYPSSSHHKTVRATSIQNPDQSYHKQQVQRLFGYTEHEI
jgi:hypothetical protein